MTNFIGIDPGASGGMACIKSEAYLPEIVRFSKATEAEIAGVLSDWFNDGDCFAYIERVGPNRGRGERKQGASTMFAFGQSYGFLRGVLIATRIPFEEVQAVKWQVPFGLRRSDKSETDTAKKNRHKAKAQQLFPAVKILHENADTLLITEYGRRIRATLERKELGL
jgi:hypothetical protein